MLAVIPGKTLSETTFKVVLALDVADDMLANVFFLPNELM